MLRVLVDHHQTQLPISTNGGIMSVPVVMKSGKNYLTLILDEEMEFAELLERIIAKFRESEKFFGEEPIAISFEGRTLSEKEQLQIMDAVDCYTSVRIATIVENDKIREYAADINIRKSLYPEEFEVDQISQEAVCTFVPRGIETGEHISSMNTIVVLGDVEKGAIVSSNEHVIVLGALYGQAIAGAEGDMEGKIIALDFSPENFRIGEVLGTLPKKKGLFHKDLNDRRKPKGSKVAFMKDGEIQIDYYL